jgi:hypothetical protein
VLVLNELYFGLYPSSGVSKIEELKIYTFSLASSVSGCVWVCVCLGLYAILVFPRF